MPDYLGKPIDQVVDGENNKICFDFAYPVRKNLPAAVKQVRSLHGDDCFLLPISAASCGGGIYQSKPSSPGPVIGLRFAPPVDPVVRLQDAPELCDLDLDEIVIDARQQLIFAGASVTLNQLNQALAQQLGHRYKVPGADLTSYQYAACGATFMTGGMGPQRRYFSDSVVRAALFNGESLQIIEADALQAYAGTYGWSGIVTALGCRYFRFPENELAFALPVSNSPKKLARLLNHLAAFTYLKLESGEALNQDDSNHLILGLEHVSRESLTPLLSGNASDQILQRAQDMALKMELAKAAGMLFIHGLSEAPIDDFLSQLIDNPEDDELTLAGIPLDHAEIFSSAEEMRDLREAIPFAARMQAAGAAYVYKNHTDANIRLEASEVAVTMEELWQINCDYVTAVQQSIHEYPDLQGQILVYGHLNPFGVDPHNRVTISAANKQDFQACREQLIELRADYYRRLAALCEHSRACFIGGEKAADSEIAIYAAVGGIEQAPAELQQKFRRQRQAVESAARILNWRAHAPYSGSRGKR